MSLKLIEDTKALRSNQKSRSAVQTWPQLDSRQFSIVSTEKIRSEWVTNFILSKSSEQAIREVFLKSNQ